MDQSAPGLFGGSEQCESCGAKFDADDRYCSFCGAQDSQWESAPAPAGAPRFFRCSGCGARVSLSSAERSYFCTFCESPHVASFDPQERGLQEPEFILGFRIAADEASKAFWAWLGRNKWFRPGALQKNCRPEKVRGAYIPCWSFSAFAESAWSAHIGEYYWRRELTNTQQKGLRYERVRKTEWRLLNGKHHGYHSGYFVSASKGLRQHEIDGVKPFSYTDLKRYNPRMVIGWPCEEYSIPSSSARETCLEAFRRRERAAIEAFLPGDAFKGLETNTRFSKVESDLCLLPLYIMTYSYGERLYRVLVNGETGAVHGEKPYSLLRIAGAVLFAVLAAAGIALLGGGR